MSDTLLASDATGAEVYSRAVGIAGASHAAASLVLLPVIPAGRNIRLSFPSSRALVMSDAASGIITSSLPTSTIATLPPLAQLAFTRDGTTELAFTFQTGGLGQFFLTPNQYLGAVANNTAMTALSAAVPGDWCQKLDDTTGGYAAGSIYMLVSGSPSILGNWARQSAANRPRVSWGVMANQAAMVALSGAVPGDWCTRTDVSGLAFKLMQAPFSTAANWEQQTTTTLAGIILNDPYELTLANLTRWHPPVRVITVGPDEYSWGWA